MNVNSKTPMALYKANLELVLRIGALLQESRQRWMQSGATGTHEAIQRTLAETERMLTTTDWSALSAMPGEEFWKSLRGGAGPLQGNVESAMRSQVEFSEGLKQAFAEWQQQSADALGGNAMQSAPPAFAEFMQGFSAPHPPAQSPRKEEARETRKPPTNKTARPKAATKASPRQKATASAKKKSPAAAPRKPTRK